MAADEPVSDSPVYVTVVAVVTSFVLNWPTGVPVTETVSPTYGLPSVLVPELVETAACNTAAPPTVASRLPSYSRFKLVSPLTVSSFCEIVAVVVGAPVNDKL